LTALPPRGRVHRTSARFALGLYLLVVVASPSLMVSTAEPRHHAFALSLWGTFVPAGIALSGIAAAAFADGAGWRIIFAVDRDRRVVDVSDIGL